MTDLLPKEIIKSDLHNPKNLIIFSKPKSGKTTLVSMLPNCLLLDFEEGSDYVDALKIKIDCLKVSDKKNEDDVSYQEVANSILGQKKETGKYPYTYVAIDTITAIEDMCEWDATEAYMNSNIGKSFNRQGGQFLPKSKWESVLTLPNGAGYFWLRESFKKWMKITDRLAPNVILLGHLKDKYITSEGKEIITGGLDLTGKISRITSANSDAIGYLYRNKDKTMLSFKGRGVECEARPAHLTGQDLVIMEKVDDKLVSYWDKVYKL